MPLKLFFASMSVKTNSASMKRKVKLTNLVFVRKILTKQFVPNLADTRLLSSIVSCDVNSLCESFGFETYNDDIVRQDECTCK